MCRYFKIMKIILSAQTIWRLYECDRILKADVGLVKLYFKIMDN